MSERVLRDDRRYESLREPRGARPTPGDPQQERATQVTSLSPTQAASQTRAMSYSCRLFHFNVRAKLRSSSEPKLYVQPLSTISRAVERTQIVSAL